MEEDKKAHFLKMQLTRKLNCPFAIKLLQENFDTPSIKTGVPFSCDRILANSGSTYETPPTPPPSSRWHPSAIEEGACTDIQLPNCVVDGFGGNEAINIFSVAETTEGLAENGKTCSTEEPDDANQSPDFVIQRFLPDAQPLAAASLAQKKLMFSSPPSANASFSRPVGASNVKGCGFRSLYRSLMKPKGRTPPRASKSDGTKETNRAKKC